MRDATLLVDTLRLSPPSNPAALIAAWSVADVPALIDLAEREGATVWLHRRLKEIEVPLPAAEWEKLSRSARSATAHFLRVDAEASATLGLLHDAGFSVIPLKGAAVRRIAARVPYINARTVADVDVIVPVEQANDAWSSLESRGYRALKETGPDLGHHLAPLVGPLGVPVELHISTIKELTPAEAWRRASTDTRLADFGGFMRPIPNDTELFWHALSHALMTEEEAVRRGLRLRNWLDAAALLAASSDIDWERVRHRLDLPETPHPSLARAWLLAAMDLSGREIPASVLGGRRARPFALERQLAWRLRVHTKYAKGSRWADKLLEEGTRGEADLPHQPGHPKDTFSVSVRHALATRAARAWWTVRR